MAAPDSIEAGPPLDSFSDVFWVYETRREDDRLVYYGEPIAPHEDIMETIWPLFRECGYEATITRRTGEYVLVAEPVEVGIDGIPWTNVALFVATLLSTLYAGSLWYYVRDPLGDPLTMLRAWPFAAAVLGVLAIHELGHYAMSRYHDVDATLPYFIPMPTIIGTMGAVIKMKGQMPSRKALFDIGVAGPLAGLVATILVTAIGLSLDPIPVPMWIDPGSPDTLTVEFGYPLLFRMIAVAVGAPGVEDPVAVLLGQQTVGYTDPRLALNPVVFGGWVGMFVTFLNLLPVGQLDGGHIVRALMGERGATVSALVPGALFGLAGFLFYFGDRFAFGEVGNAVGLWVFWGLLALVFAFTGAARPIHDEPIGTRRTIVGLVAFALGLLCFTPVPVQIVG